MNRRVVAGILGLVLAGCAQDRSLVSRSRPPVPSVEITPPLASIHDAINREHSHLDPESIRAGHPAEYVERPRLAASTSTSAAGAPSSAPPETPPQDPAPAPTETLAQAETLPPASTPSERPTAAQAHPATSPPSAPEPQGRVRIALPPVGGIVESPAAATKPPAESPRTIVRDPLLGANPDIMPVMELPATTRAPEASAGLPGSPSPLAEGAATGAASAEESRLAAVEVPATVPQPGMPPGAPSSPMTVVDLPDVAEAPPGASKSPTAPPLADYPMSREPVPAPVETRTEPEPVVPPAPAVSATEPAQPGPRPAPAPARYPDPLLGPNPDVMPTFELPPVPAPVTVSVPAHAHPRGPAYSPTPGTPPIVTELPGSLPTLAVPPASPSPRAENAGATVDPAPPIGSPNALPKPSAATPAEPASTVNEVYPKTSTLRQEPVVRELKTQEAALSDGTRAPAFQAPERDPLLGANPDVMPTIKLPPPAAKAPEPAVAPTPTPAPTPAPTSTPVVTPPAKPPVAPRPARRAIDPLSDPIELPPLADPEASTPGSASLSRRGLAGFASVPVSAPADKGRDPAVRQAASPAAASEPTAVRSRVPSRTVFEAGQAAARVGDDVITIHELKVAMAQRRKGMPIDRDLTPDEKVMLARVVLNDLIDRSVVLQEAKHDLKDAKNFKNVMDIADKVWLAEEMPPMLQRTASANIYELKRKMAEQGESLDEIREQFRLEFLSRGYLEQKLSPRMKVDLLEMREYYSTHLKDFDRPAQVTWREVLIEIDASKTRAEARRKADALLARLRRGEDFATVARTGSEGPNKSSGGLWQTAPGSYAVPAVNAALESLPLGQVSQVLEGPTSYHIVVVEARRSAGPAPFAEVQKKIWGILRQEKVHRESTAYLDKLRKRTIIINRFEDPNVIRASGERVTPAPGR